MVLKYFIILALLKGLWMIVDGFHVLMKGKYIDPPTPGPWRHIISALSVNPFRIAPAFLCIGVGWLIFSIGLIAGYSRSWLTGIAVSIMSLWYLPFGTLISIIILA